MKKALTLIAALMIAAVAGLFAQAAAQQTAAPQTAADLIMAGDEAYAKFDDAGARVLYEQAAKLEPTNYEALWKTSRAYLDVGDRMVTKTKAEEQQRIKLYLTSEDYAKKAVKANPNDTWGYFFDSAAMGMHALQLSKKQQVNMAKQIKTAIDKAIQLDPTNDLAYNALGQWNRAMAEIGGASRFLGGILFGGIPKGSFAEAVKAFQKGIELKPNYSNHHLELGRTYLSMKKKDLAAKEFQAAIDSEIRTSKCSDYIAEAKAELAKLKKK
jgi:tetratricopeptide (TPR) repeat protein